MAIDNTELEKIAKRIRTSLVKTLKDVVAVGKDLQEAKKLVGPDRKFMKWVRENVRISQRSAQNFMNVAEKLDGKCETVAHLKLSTVYKIASVPDHDRTQILEKLKDGKAFDDRKVLSMLQPSKVAKEPKVATTPNHAASELAAVLVKTYAADLKRLLKLLKSTTTSDIADVINGAEAAPGLDQARRALKTYATINGNEEAVRLLGQFSPKASFDDMKPERYADFIAATEMRKAG